MCMFNYGDTQTWNFDPGQQFTDVMAQHRIRVIPNPSRQHVTSQTVNFSSIAPLFCGVTMLTYREVQVEF